MVLKVNRVTRTGNISFSALGRKQGQIVELPAFIFSALVCPLCILHTHTSKNTSLMSPLVMLLLNFWPHISGYVQWYLYNYIIVYTVLYDKQCNLTDKEACYLYREIPNGRNGLRQSFRQPRIGVDDLCINVIQVFFYSSMRHWEESAFEMADLSKWNTFWNCCFALKSWGTFFSSSSFTCKSNTHLSGIWQWEEKLKYHLRDRGDFFSFLTFFSLFLSTQHKNVRSEHLWA